MDSKIQYLKSRLDYNALTGVFSWKSKNSINSNVKIGSKAGGKNEKGYIVFCLSFDGKRKNVYAHRVAWSFIYGSWPSDQIDHINGNPSDNSINNLRIVSNRENQQNRKSHRLGGLVGATYSTREKKWKAQAAINKSRIHLGTFDTQAEAHNAYSAFLLSKGL